MGRAGGIVALVMTVGLCVGLAAHLAAGRGRPRPLLLAGKERGGMVTVRPKQSDDVLINPGAGWQLLVVGRPGREMEEMPLVSTFYYRTSWTEFEPEPGHYEDAPAVRTIDAWLEEAARHGRYVAIRVVPWNSRNPDYQRRSAQKVNGYDSPVPSYIFRAGAKGFAEPGGSGGWVPVFWDAVYLRHHRRLAAFLGQRYGGHPNLAYIDVPAANYGEMNLTNTGVPELDDLSLWKQYGLTAKSWSNMLRELCDMYRSAFPNDLLVAARDYTMYAGGRETLPYAVKNEVGFRDDGLGMSYCGPGRENPEYEQNWPKVLCLYENGYGGWLDWGGKRRIGAILDWAVDRTHASIVMVGKWQAGRDAYDRYPEYVRKYGQRLGYRLVIEEASWPVSVRAGRQLPISLAWANLGNAPPYADFALEASLLAGSGKVAASHVVAPATLGTRTWLPGKARTVRIKMPVPGRLKAGAYRLAVSLFEARNPRASRLQVRRRIQLGMADGDAARRYPLGALTIE